MIMILSKLFCYRCSQHLHEPREDIVSREQQHAITVEKSRYAEQGAGKYGGVLAERDDDGALHHHVGACQPGPEDGREES